MQNNLEKLTEKIYQEGIEKAQNEAEEIIKQAKEKALDIERKAQESAQKTVSEAKKQAEEIQKSTEAELQLSVNQSVEVLKQRISNLVSSKILSEKINVAFDNDKFIQELILKIIEKWQPQNNETLNLKMLISEEKSKKFLTAGIKNQIEKVIEIKFDNTIKEGFKLYNKNENYQISFTKEAFEQFLKKYMRTKISEILFG